MPNHYFNWCLYISAMETFCYYINITAVLSDGLMQTRHHSIANVLKLHLTCTNISIMNLCFEFAMGNGCTQTHVVVWFGYTCYYPWLPKSMTESLRVYNMIPALMTAPRSIKHVLVLIPNYSTTNQANNMAANALAPRVARPSAAMKLTNTDKEALVYHQEKF